MTTRMIERWFPCAEVSERSAKGWGTGFAEKSLFPWFASRPLAQAKAAVICSLLPWPDDEREQEGLKKLVREAMKDYDAKNSELRRELAKHYPNGVKICDPFSGRAMIPLEAARLGVQAWGIDYSPVATIAGMLLADYPLRDWDNEPDLPFDGYQQHKTEYFAEPRLLRDVRFVLGLVGDRYTEAMGEFYPLVGGKRPWGYVWGITLPCTNCGNRFPFTGSLKLRNPNPKKHDLGQSYRIVADSVSGVFNTEVKEGSPDTQPTLVKRKGVTGKTAVCCFCDHAHTLDTQKRMMRDGLRDDALLVVADLDNYVGKHYRVPVQADFDGLRGVAAVLEREPPFALGLPAVPTERIDPKHPTLRPVGYGYQRWGDLCNTRQTLGFVRLARIIDNACRKMLTNGISSHYAAALTGYAASNLVRRMKYSTRSASLQVGRDCAGHIYFNDSGISHSFDYFETGCGGGPATWGSLASHTINSLKRQVARVGGRPTLVQRGSATELPLPDDTLDAIVTDPPYDAMINYCDSSDLMYVWLKRALRTGHPWFGVTTDPDGLQEKTNEAVIKCGSIGDDHRTEAHYKSCITKAFDQARLKVGAEGVVSIVFGHGDPDAWARVLTAITDAGLVLTGSWPCSTEKGGKQTGEYINNTIMMACRAAAAERPVGDVRRVDDEVRAEIARRVPIWTADGLADSDQRMAAIAPAMEVVGRYSEVRDFTGVPVPIQHFLGLAHKAVEEAANVRIDKFRLTDFDERTRFAISWARQHGRRVAAASEARWQRLSYDMSDSDVEGIITKAKGGSRLAYGNEFAKTSRSQHLNSTSAVIDIALAVANEGRSLSDIADALHVLDRENDEMLWAAMTELARLVSEGDSDGQIWAWAVRNRQLICGQAQRARTEHQKELKHEAAQDSQTRLF